MKKIIISVIVLIVVIIAGASAFFYLTRPVAAPIQNIETAAAVNEFSTSTEGTTYRISQNSSDVTFTISEVLHGSPKIVVGTTTAVAGDISIIPGASGSSSMKVGVLTIDATSFVTDSSERNAAINRFILKSGSPGNQYITFTPTNVTGLPATIPTGTPFSFQVTGNLFVSSVTKPTTFDVTATQNNGSLSGTASTSLKRSDFGLVIPNIPFVANVPDTFQINVSFVADKVQ